MKRKIIVRTADVVITAVIRTHGRRLMRYEVEIVRAQLADRLQEAAANLRYFNTPRHRVRVS